MMNRFIITYRETDYLLSPSVKDWLPENHLARFITEVVAQLDLTEITNQNQGRGSKAQQPVTLHNLLIYGYAAGFSQIIKLSERLTIQLSFATLLPIPIQTTLPSPYFDVASYLSLNSFSFKSCCSHENWIYLNSGKYYWMARK
jgi:hypothetical protein